jgi:hypothetical protein
MSTNSKPQFYTLPLKKAVNMMTDADRSMNMFAENVKTMVEKYDIMSWGDSPIPDYMDAYLNAKVLRDYLQKSIENPDEMVKAYLKKNNIDGLLFSREELTMLHTLSTNFEENKEYISKKYGFTTMLN